MKTTLVIDDTLLGQLRREAARQGRTMSELVESALRTYLRPQKGRPEPTPLPTFRGGRELVDIADRNAMHDAMEED
jgi:hypothetical protein